MWTGSRRTSPASQRQCPPDRPGAVTGGAIRLHQLAKSFDGYPAVNGIDLDIPAGQFYSLLGASGCGKTTTLRMIAGFEKPDSGRIELDGRDVAGDPPHRRPVNTVFQTYALFPFMSVWENVAFGLKYQKASREETRQRVDEALELVRMGSFAKRQPRTALRRSAAAGGAGPRAGPAAERVTARRAAGRAGRQAAQAASARTAGHAARGRHHLRLRHARSGRGAHDERPDRRARGGPRRADRTAPGDLLGAGHHLRRRIPRGGQHLRRRRARDRGGLRLLRGTRHQARRRCGRLAGPWGRGDRDSARTHQPAGPRRPRPRGQ